VIKIDGTFVREMPRNDADQLVVKAIVEIARGLGKRTIAEFVEDEATRQLLQDYGVDMAQGYHLGRPVDSAELSAA
jgi:EAL domain-containing protein (putative c-di-GMP-specific phosphodiesterase class I)